MKKIQKSIEVIRAHDIRFSSMGLKSGVMIRDLLSKYYSEVRLTMIKNSDDLENLVLRRPDLVILGLKRIESNGQKIWLSEFLDDHAINYTGSNKAAMALDLNKADAKKLMCISGIPTANFFTATPEQYSYVEELPLSFPLFIKPHDQGGGGGIGADSVVRDFPSFQKKVMSIYDKYKTFSLVEEYLDGREFSVGLFGAGYEEDLIAMPIELITTPNESGDRILGQDVKSEDNERAVYIKNKEVRTQVAELARNAYRVLGGRDYGRIDLRMDGQGKAHFMEANLTPGIAENEFVSYFNRACELNAGMNYEAIILGLVDIAMSRSDLIDESPDLSPIMVPA